MRRVTVDSSSLPRKIKQRRRTWTCSCFKRDEAERMSLTGSHEERRAVVDLENDPALQVAYEEVLEVSRVAQE